MIAEQSLECEAPASLWIPDKIRKSGWTAKAGQKTKAAQECRSPKSGRSA